MKKLLYNLLVCASLLQIQITLLGYPNSVDDVITELESIRNSSNSLSQTGSRNLGQLRANLDMAQEYASYAGKLPNTAKYGKEDPKRREIQQLVNSISQDYYQAQKLMR